MSRTASVCTDCGTTDEIHHHNCATHERDWPEARADAIGQNGGDGLHYAEGGELPSCPGWVTCGCGDMFPADSYGAGFMDANGGACEGCYAEDSDGESALSQALSMPSKYHVRLKGAWCDVYDVLQAFGVTNPADQHAIKKMLMPGKRGAKDGIQDRREAIQSLHRAIELEDEQ